MICNKCNSEIPENSKFCQVCGNEINKLENIVPIVNNSKVINNNSIENQPINIDNIVNNNNNCNQTNNIDDINNQQKPVQNNNKNDNGSLKTISVLLGIVGIVAMFFHSTIASVIFILGIIIGAIYKSKTKNKCFGLTLNIIGLILNIIFFFGAVLIVNNTLNDVRKSAECTEKGGYWKNGKCIGAIIEEDEGTKNNKKEEEKENNPNINNNSNASVNNTYIGTWSCKDNGDDPSMLIKPLDQIDESEYKIGLTFVDNQKYMLTHSTTKWEKGTYTILLTKTDDYGKYYHLEMIVEEMYDLGYTNITDILINVFDIIIDSNYQRMFLMSKDGSINYSCYKD